MADQDSTYQPVDAVGEAITHGAILGTAGLVLSATSNALARENIGMMGIFTRTGGSVASFGLFLLQ